MSPVGIHFDRAGLAGVHVQVDIWAAGDDRVLPLAANANRIRLLLPSPPEFTLVPRVGHFVFLAPCSEQMEMEHPTLCSAPTLPAWTE